LALPGAIGQVTIATILGLGVARLWGWSFGEGLVFGVAISVASTVVLLRALGARGAVSSPEGSVAVGWVIVQDLVMVLALVLLPALAGPLGGTATNSDGSLLITLMVTLGKVVLFGVVMFVAGIRVIPRLLAWIERTGSRELFVLSILAAALGIAYGAAELFGVSFALGAFLAGVVVNESEFSHRAAEEALPLREAFAVLFFVSVGMLIDPGFLIDHLDRILIVSGSVALTIVRVLGGSLWTGLTVAAGVAQIGEFSFILAELGIGLNLLPDEGRDLILAGALVSITLSPLVWRAADVIAARAQVRHATLTGSLDKSKTPLTI
jgi:monovalent cation:H+ antiporter-2, CPA2 family